MLSAKGLVKNFGKFEAVKNISLEIPDGKIIAFLGPNGAGKTTTMKMIAGILQPDSGSILIDGIDLLKHPVPAKKIIGYVSDRPYLYEKLTGREMLSFVLNLFANLDKLRHQNRVEEMLSQIDMSQFGNDLIENYSHGMKQRIAIGCGLIHNPRFLIIDEPMVGLDPHGYKMLFTLLQNFKKQGGAIFLSTHTLQDAEQIADSYAIIKNGQLIPYHRDSADYANLEEFYFKLIEKPH